MKLVSIMTQFPDERYPIGLLITRMNTLIQWDSTGIDRERRKQVKKLNQLVDELKTSFLLAKEKYNQRIIKGSLQTNRRG